MFPSDMRIPAPHFSRMLLRDFMISYRPVYPGDKGSPLREDIDNTVRLELAYDQNTFSLEAVSINYDYPSNILYSWKLEGLYEGWSHPVQSGRIQFTSLPPGNYTLRIRAVSNEEKYKVYEERSLGLSAPGRCGRVHGPLPDMRHCVCWLGWCLFALPCCAGRKGYQTKRRASSYILPMMSVLRLR